MVDKPVDNPGANDQGTDRTKEENDAARLAQQQYDLAAEYRGQYVVLVGPKVICHTTDEDEASAAYYQSLRTDPNRPPVFISPDAPRDSGTAIQRSRTAVE